LTTTGNLTLSMTNMNLMQMQPFKVIEAKRVVSIDISNNNLMTVASLGQFKNLRCLKVAYNRLMSIESVLFSLPREKLAELNIRGN